MAIGRRIFSRPKPAIPSGALGTVIHKPASPRVLIQPRPNGNAGSLTIIAVITPNNPTVKMVQSTARARKPRSFHDMVNPYLEGHSKTSPSLDTRSAVTKRSDVRTIAPLS